MFDALEEKLILTWMAITWLLEDYDIQYWRILRQWSVVPPTTMANHSHFCFCPHKNKWNPTSTLSSGEYNWPLIIGPKSTAVECKATYKQFFQEYIHHCDPVGYRAIIFVNILAD